MGDTGAHCRRHTVTSHHSLIIRYGFKSVFSDDISCVILLISSWKLDTKAKFAVACEGTFCLAILTEACTWSRRELRAHFSKRAPTTHGEAALSAMYSLQVFLG